MADYTSPNLGIPFLSETQAGKATTVNVGLSKVDELLMLTVVSRTVAAPPASPAEGTRYIVPAGATGAWAGQDGKLAGYYGGWRFTQPLNGWLAFSQGDNDFLRYLNGGWNTFSGAGKALDLDDLGDVNASTPADKDVLSWNAASGTWKSSAAASGGVTTLDALNDVDSSARADGKLLAWDETAGKHVYVSPGGGGASGVGTIVAWANLYGFSTSLRASGNVVSVTHNAAGDYTFNFANYLVDDHFAAVFGGKWGTEANDFTMALVSEPRLNTGPSRAANYLRVRTNYQGGGTGSSYDMDTINMVCVR